MPSYSGVWTLTAVYQAVGAGNWSSFLQGNIGLFGGGDTSGNTIDYIIYFPTRYIITYSGYFVTHAWFFNNK